MSTDTGIEAYAVDDLLGVQAFGFCVGIQLVEVGNAKSQIGIGKQLHSFSFCKSHKQSINIFFDGALLKKSGKNVSLGS